MQSRHNLLQMQDDGFFFFKFAKFDGNRSYRGKFWETKEFVMEPSLKLLTERQASQMLAVSMKALQLWRYQRRGPDYVKMGRSVRYRLESLQAYIKSSAVCHG
jgi:predicted DNA-binding transcriptional regulator AlpA